LPITGRGESARYVEDFNDGQAQGWHDPWGFFYGVQPSAEPGHAPFVLAEENCGWMEGGADLFCFYTRQRFGDFDLSLEVRDGYASEAHFWEGRYYGSSDFGVIFRAAEAEETVTSYYRLSLCPVALWRHGPQKDELEPLSATGTHLARDPDWPRWHTVRIKAQGPFIQVWLDQSEKPLIEAKDEAFTEGHIGLKSQHWPNHWLVDNLAVRSLGE
jgi:hypothetical protein